VALVALVFVALLRQPGLSATKTLWAEDGQVWYTQALRESFFKSITTTYDGYIQLVPRLGSEFVARLFSIQDASAATAVLGDVILGCILLLVFHTSRSHVRSIFARGLLLGSMILLPMANAELLNNFVNLPWWQLFATFWVLLWRPQSIWEKGIAAVFCFLAAMSNPVAALFLPLALARVIALPRWREQLATMGLLLGLALEGVAVLTSNYHSVNPPKTTHGVLSLFFLRVGTGSIGGVQVTNALIVLGDHKIGIALGACVFATAIVLVAACRSLRLALFGAFALVSCALIFAIEVWYRGVAGQMTLSTVDVGSRYAQTPLLLLLSVIIVAVAASAPAGPLWRLPPLGLILVALLLLPGWIVDFNSANGREQGPNWPAEVAQARKECRPGSHTSVTIPVSPTPGWNAVVSCLRLRP
jgi:hypothetical protein